MQTQQTQLFFRWVGVSEIRVKLLLLLGHNKIKNSHSTQTHPRQQKPNSRLEY